MEYANIGNWRISCIVYRSLINSFREFVARLIIVGLLLGVAWLVLQYYSEEEIAAAARQFWAWWSTLLSGELASYWNPGGAAIVLGAALLFVLNPLTRLLGLSRRGRGRSYSDGNFDDSSAGDDGAASG